MFHKNETSYSKNIYVVSALLNSMKKTKTIKASKIIPKEAIVEVSKETGAKRPRLSIVWKIVAIVVIVAFALLIIGGALKARHFKESFVKPTQAQVESAETIATAKLLSLGLNASDYNISAADRMPSIDREGKKQSILQVTFYSSKTTHMFLVDMNSGEVLQHVQTDVYGDFENRNPMPGFGPHPDNRIPAR